MFIHGHVLYGPIIGTQGSLTLVQLRVAFPFGESLELITRGDSSGGLPRHIRRCASQVAHVGRAAAAPRRSAARRLTNRSPRAPFCSLRRRRLSAKLAFVERATAAPLAAATGTDTQPARGHGATATARALDFFFF